MKIQRRTFTKEFKLQTVMAVLKNEVNKKALSSQLNISIPLLDRWINDYVATQQPISNIFPISDRRKDYQDTQTLKAKIADLYMQLEGVKKDYSLSAQVSRV